MEHAEKKRRCLVVAAGEHQGCSRAYYPKHDPFPGLKPEHTRKDPARYLSRPAIEPTEKATIRLAPHRGGALPGKTEYLRDTGEVLGYDEGYDATWSFVECGSVSALRREFHGRPMHKGNKKVRGMTDE